MSPYVPAVRPKECNASTGTLNGSSFPAHCAAEILRPGRAAIGNPWIFSEVRKFLESGERSEQPSYQDMIDIITMHLLAIYLHYGEYTGVRIARKHILKYCNLLPAFDLYRKKISNEEQCELQLQQVKDYLNMAQSMSIAA